MSTTGWLNIADYATEKEATVAGKWMVSLPSRELEMDEQAKGEKKCMEGS